MAELFDTIRRLVSKQRYIIGQHASERLEERGIMDWQVVDGIESGRLLRERRDARPNCIVEVAQILADGTEVKAVWSHIVAIDVAKLVTVHFFDEE